LFNVRTIASCWSRLSPKVILCAALLLSVASCSFTGQPVLTSSDLDRGWPATQLAWRPTEELPANWAEGKQLWKPTTYPMMQVALPQIAGATFTQLDAQCVICHETYVTAFATNVHRQQGCEQCHGATSKHLESRGGGQATILSLKPPDTMTATGQATTPAERAELCLQCHESPSHNPATNWRTSAHAQRNLTCPDCHVAHYDVPPGTPPADLGRRRAPDTRLVQWSPEAILGRDLSGHLGAATPAGCYRCHSAMKRFEDAGHPHQIGTVIPVPQNGSKQATDAETFNCTTCHDPHGNVVAGTRKELCLTCHEGPHMREWRGSPHDLAGIGCTDCHDPHPTAGRAMSVQQPQVCYRCHAEKRQLEEIAGPHQLLGPNRFNCTTCHRPHGRVTSQTRTDLCLGCHTGTPTMAWHSSYHDRQGVACADCHDAHPNAKVPEVIAIAHETLDRPSRRPMRVAEPDTCYKCHPKIFALASLPSHHPIREGKIRCSDCHDAHGEEHKSLKSQTLNELCFECHTDKEGPFVWEHAPVTESCANCHEAHGTVANNLLQQPPVFLCLRCHTSHSTHGASQQCTRCHQIEFPGGDITTLVGGGPQNPMIPTTPTSRQALFTDCTQCHSQIHGSDFATGFECGNGMRR
jgi:DmsE family decaheme c-type cytochrome